MKKIILLFSLFCSTLVFAQITYQKGYFITNDGSKTDCLIEDVDWDANPTSFRYKSNETDAPKTITIADVREFAIEASSQYKRFTVNIEFSPSLRDARLLSKNKEPKFRRETLFLKTLAAGDANLYSYSGENVTKYFFETKSKPIEQLIHIVYTDEREENIMENNQFRQQLLNGLACANMGEADFKKLSYKKNSLAGVFNKFNQCNGSLQEHNSYTQPQKRNNFDLRLLAGISAATLSLTDESTIYNVSSDFSGTAFRFGLEGEYILPFNKGTWSIFFAPSYQKFEDEISFSRPDGFPVMGSIIDYDAKAQYATIEVPLGLRRYFYVGNASRIFISVMYSRNFDAGSGTIVYTNHQNRPNADHTENLLTRSHVAIGLGFNYKAIGAEFKYHTPRKVGGGQDTKFAVYGIELSYRLF